MASNSGQETRLIDVFLVARSVIAALVDKGGLQFPVPVPKPDGVLGIVEHQAGPSGIKRVDVFCRDWRSEQFVSALFRRKDSADIHYSAHASLALRRFAICKEAMHLLIDKEECHFTTDPLLLIERLIVGDFTAYAPDTPLGSEAMGLIAAIETVLPWQLRPVLEKMSEAGESDYQIAAQAKVPLKYVTAMLHGSYDKMSARMNKELDNKQL